MVTWDVSSLRVEGKLSLFLCQKRGGWNGLAHYRTLFQNFKQQFIPKLTLKAVNYQAKDDVFHHLHENSILQYEKLII